MYLRRTQRVRKDGSSVGYVQLAHNSRVGGVTRAEVLVNLGREDELDLEGLRRLARSISRYTGGEPPVAGEAAGEGLSVVSSRPLGGVWVLDALWRRSLILHKAERNVAKVFSFAVRLPQSAGGGLCAVCSICPHMGCLFRYETDYEDVGNTIGMRLQHPVFHCGCHDSTFDPLRIDSVISGPSPLSSASNRRSAPCEQLTITRVTPASASCAT
jgi:nitrite reductase/ring-hydroxylating ferredoxin subunit